MINIFSFKPLIGNVLVDLYQIKDNGIIVKASGFYVLAKQFLWLCKSIKPWWTVRMVNLPIIFTPLFLGERKSQYSLSEILTRPEMSDRHYLGHGDSAWSTVRTHYWQQFALVIATYRHEYCTNWIWSTVFFKCRIKTEAFQGTGSDNETEQNESVTECAAGAKVKTNCATPISSLSQLFVQRVLVHSDSCWLLHKNNKLHCYLLLCRGSSALHCSIGSYIICVYVCGCICMYVVCL